MEKSFDGKVPRSVRAGDDVRIRFNSKLQELLNDIYIVQRINKQRLRWHGQVVHMEEDDPVRQVFDAGICGNRRKG